jgi:transposase-like protein
MVCLEAVALAKWPKGCPECLKCAGKRVSFIRSRMLWTCLSCRKQFSVKVGTIFEDSPIGLDKWLCAMWMLANRKNNVSSYEIARALKVPQRTAWSQTTRPWKKSKPKPKRPPGYRKFEKLLKQIIAAPPLNRGLSIEEFPPEEPKRNPVSRT